jgi:hypothetical protein
MTSRTNRPTDHEGRFEPDGADGPGATWDADQSLAELLSTTWAPSELSPGAQERLVSLALEDPLAPATELERTEAARLRRALEGGPICRDADLARAFALAAGGGNYDVERATQSAALRAGLPSPRQTNVIYVAFAATALAAAAAAAILLSLFPVDRPALVTAPAEQQMVLSRSTASLFQEKFAVGKTSERVDLIVAARARELRANRFAAWGIR